MGETNKKWDVTFELLLKAFFSDKILLYFGFEYKTKREGNMDCGFFPELGNLQRQPTQDSGRGKIILVRMGREK